MLINRYLNVEKSLLPGRVLVLLGPRRTGKTTLIQGFLNNTHRNAVLYRGDQLSVQNNFSVYDSAVLDDYIGDYDTIVIDEAQMIPNIGRSLKLIVDTHPKINIVVTGSSAFELNGQIGEPLTGRKLTRYILPISVQEMLDKSQTPALDFNNKLEKLLTYGMYPNIITAKSTAEKKEFLQELLDSYLLKDILAFQEVKGSQLLLQLLSLLAFQIGSEVSATELGSQLGINRKTIERYLDLLQKAFVIYRLGGLSRNLRSEITRKPKYYFYDNGIRNAIIGNFNSLNRRNDVGQLWENFVITERLKSRLYTDNRANQYFWRTWQGSEIDLVEERGGMYYGYEIKWSDKTNISVPKLWSQTYGAQGKWKLINPKTFLSFVTVTKK